MYECRSVLHINVEAGKGGTNLNLLYILYLLGSLYLFVVDYILY